MVPSEILYVSAGTGAMGTVTVTVAEVMSAVGTGVVPPMTSPPSVARIINVSDALYELAFGIVHVNAPVLLTTVAPIPSPDPPTSSYTGVCPLKPVNQSDTTPASIVTVFAIAVPFFVAGIAEVGDVYVVGLATTSALTITGTKANIIASVKTTASNLAKLFLPFN
jgi:hypothetical protein